MVSNLKDATYKFNSKKLPEKINVRVDFRSNGGYRDEIFNITLTKDEIKNFDVKKHIKYKIGMKGTICDIYYREPDQETYFGTNEDSITYSTLNCELTLEKCYTYYVLLHDSIRIHDFKDLLEAFRYRYSKKKNTLYLIALHKACVSRCELI